MYTKIYHKLLVAVCVKLRSFGILYWQQNYCKQHNDCYDNTTISEFSISFCADFAMYNILPLLQCINEVSQIVSHLLSNIKNCIMLEASGGWLTPDKSQWEAALWGGFGFCLNPSYWCRQYWLKLSGSGTIRFLTPKVLQDFERSHWWFRMLNKHQITIENMWTYTVSIVADDGLNTFRAYLIRVITKFSWHSSDKIFKWNFWKRIFCCRVPMALGHLQCQLISWLFLSAVSPSVCPPVYHEADS